jgi:hypothetical protein
MTKTKKTMTATLTAHVADGETPAAECAGVWTTIRSRKARRAEIEAEKAKAKAKAMAADAAARAAAVAQAKAAAQLAYYTYYCDTALGPVRYIEFDGMCRAQSM